jgi:hypothetical protein
MKRHTFLVFNPLSLITLGRFLDDLDIDDISELREDVPQLLLRDR